MSLSLLGIAAAVLAPLPPLHVEGHRLVDPQGKEVLLKGANLGNWLVTEFWMWALRGEKPKDQFDLEALFTRRFGEAEKDRLMDVYRSSWITDRDLKFLPTFGFNVVRLPMNYRLMEDDRHPFQLKKDAWKWIDRALDLAEQNGLYTILDMHGAQGGQNPYDHTGHADQNHLKDDPEAQKRLAWLWGELAKRYRNRSAVVAYDVFNEPYGTPKPKQVEIFSKVLTEIRRFDPEKLVYAHGNSDDFAHYGDPKANGWHNVGFEMHYYPGLFGGGDPTIKTQAKHLARLAGVAEQVKKLDVPFLVGEMNVVFDSAGGAEMMRRTFDLHASYGWGTTMWAYKVMTDDGGVGDACWGAVVNADPAPQIDLYKASEKEIESYFRNFATMRLVPNAKLQKALGDPNYKPLPLPPGPMPRTTAPQEVWDGWTGTDIGGALKGGLERRKFGFSLYGGGGDIWGSSDSFRFLHRETEGDFELEVVLNGVEDIDSYTKAGLMIRGSEAADAPFALLSCFPNGELQLAHRDTAGGDTTAPPTVRSTGDVVSLRLTRRGGTITAAISEIKGVWKTVAAIPDKLPSKVSVGVVACSHDSTQLARVNYFDLKLNKL